MTTSPPSPTWILALAILTSFAANGGPAAYAAASGATGGVSSGAFGDDVPVRRALPVTIQDRLGALPAQTYAGADRYQALLVAQHPEVNPGFTPVQLRLARRQDAGVDQCTALDGQRSLLNTIEGAVRSSAVARPIVTNSIIDRAYGLPGRAASLPVSLLSHPLCEQGNDALAWVLGPDYVPDATTARRLRDFAARSNAERAHALRWDDRALAAFVNHWTQMMGCLAYEESLQTTGEPGTESAASNQADFARALDLYPAQAGYFAEHAGGMPVQPPGVQFGLDHPGGYFLNYRRGLQQIRAEAEQAIPSSADATARVAALKNYRAPRQSALLAQLDHKYTAWPVVGMFQFDPDAYGNVGICVQQWNEMVQAAPQCHIPRRNGAVMQALASYGQTFNSWCGVQKIVESFNSQVNTQNPTGVDPSNILPDGSLKAPADRCVSLVARGGTGRMYAHFGVLSNSVKDNLGKLMRCVDFATRY